MKKILLLQEPGISTAETRKLAAEIIPGWTLQSGNDPVDHTALITVRRPVDREMLKRLLGGMVSIAVPAYDHIDLHSAREYGVAVANVPGHSTTSISEKTFSLAIGLLEETSGSHGAQLDGKTVGIIGTGSIGIQTAGLFRASGCRVLGWSRSRRAAFPGEYVPLERLLRESDIISIHIPLNDGTRRFLDSSKLEMMKEGAVLVNTARKGLVDPWALKAQLRSGHLSGAVIDVPNEEQEVQEGGNTLEELQTRAREALLNIAAWERGERRNRVD